MYRPVATLLLLSFAATAHAEPTPVPGRVLNEMVAGSTVVIDAPMGYKLPIRHGDDGTITGEAGGLAFYLGSSTDTGRWWVADDRLCYKWSKWFKSETRCMRVRRDGNRIEWEKDDGDSGTGTLTLRQHPLPSKQPTQTASAERPPTRIINAPVHAAANAGNSSESPPASQPAATSQASAAASRAAPQRVAQAQPKPEPTPVAAAAKPVEVASPAQRPAAPASKPAQNIQLAQAGIQTSAQAVGPQPAAAQSAPRLGAQPSPPYRVGGPPAPLQGSYRVVSVAANDVLYVRVGPSKEHPSIATIAPEARGVRMVGPCQAEWCLVRHLGVVGWVNTYYLEPATSGLAGSSIPRVPPER